MSALVESHEERSHLQSDNNYLLGVILSKLKKRLVVFVFFVWALFTAVVNCNIAIMSNMGATPLIVASITTTVLMVLLYFATTKN